MKKFFILLITALAFAALTSCSKLTEEDLYGDYPDDTNTPSDTEASDTADTTTEDPTDTADTNAQGDTDINDTDVNDTDVNDTDVNDTDVNDTDPTDPTTDPTDPTTDPTDPTTDPTDPTTDPTDPTTDPTDPTTDPTDPTTDPTDPTTDPTDPTTDPTDPTTDPTDPTTDPTDPTTDPTDPTTDPTDPTTDPTDPTTDPTDPTEPACVPTSQCGDKYCGFDDCGNPCGLGDCGLNAACNAEQTECVPYECDQITVSQLKYRNFSGSNYQYKATYTGNTEEDFHLMINYNNTLSGIVDLSNFPKFNYCNKAGYVCLYIQGYDNPEELYFQQSGTIDLSSFNTSNGSLSAPLSSVRLVETGYNMNTSATYEIPGGKCIEVTNETLYFPGN